MNQYIFVGACEQALVHQKHLNTVKRFIEYRPYSGCHCDFVLKFCAAVHVKKKNGEDMLVGSSLPVESPTLVTLKFVTAYFAFWLSSIPCSILSNLTTHVFKKRRPTGRWRAAIPRRLR